MLIDASRKYLVSFPSEARALAGDELQSHPPLTVVSAPLFDIPTGETRGQPAPAAVAGVLPGAGCRFVFTRVRHPARGIGTTFGS
ncbi:hypothetical protein BOSEA31B_13839 [Hyphomicrobiales bacterium]|nr:hypothetical protein BOSEA31B_13839 [Hyphomicrobiales bacterium]CAH1699615.1 hypothetical protein BOSEA1005_12668 [Hyphomicrobiales bacterium]CAI0343967.1 hypothetical protein BO1005MUT1_300163 [Hyphomicrobiales bacterium]